MPGTVTISLPGKEADLRRLTRWLRDEDELRGRVSLAKQPIKDGEMGGALDAVVVGLSSGGAATVLIRSLFSWLTRRRELGAVRLRIRTENGREVELDCGSPDELNRMTDDIKALLDDGTES